MGASIELVVEVEDGRRVVIELLEAEAPMSLVQRLATFDPVQHGGEVMAVSAIGAEQW